MEKRTEHLKTKEPNLEKMITEGKQEMELKRGQRKERKKGIRFVRCSTQSAEVENVSEASDMADGTLIPSTTVKTKVGRKRPFDWDGESECFVLDQLNLRLVRHPD